MIQYVVCDQVETLTCTGGGVDPLDFGRRWVEVEAHSPDEAVRKAGAEGPYVVVVPMDDATLFRTTQEYVER